MLSAFKKYIVYVHSFLLDSFVFIFIIYIRMHYAFLDTGQFINSQSISPLHAINIVHIFWSRNGCARHVGSSRAYTRIWIHDANKKRRAAAGGGADQDVARSRTAAAARRLCTSCLCGAILPQTGRIPAARAGAPVPKPIRITEITTFGVPDCSKICQNRWNNNILPTCCL